MAVDIVAESERRKAVAVFPGRAEGGCPFRAAIEVEAVLACFEAARAEAAVEPVGTDSEDYEIHISIAVDIERVGAGCARIMRRRVAERGKGQAAVFTAVVAEQLCRIGAAGKKQVGIAVAVAIECRDPTAGEIFPRAAIDMFDAGLQRDILKARLSRLVIIIERGRAARRQGAGNKRRNESAQSDDPGWHYSLRRNWPY